MNGAHGQLRGQPPLPDPSQPWSPQDAPAIVDDRRHAPATLRNRDAIAAVLAHHLPPSGLVVEIASGSGEHAAYFAPRFHSLSWQPSDPDPAALASIRAWTAGLTNVAAAVALDAASLHWPVARADALLCCNMVHIAPWSAAVGLFAGAGRLLPAGAPIILYGPFLEDDVPTADSNLAFDADLRARNPDWGLRDVAALDALAWDHGLARVDRVPMPANNLSLVWRRL